MSAENVPARALLTTDFPLQPSNEVLNMLFEHMLNGVSFCRVIFDGDRPVDWVYLYTNPAFHAQTRLGPVVGSRASQVFPDLQGVDAETLACFGRVAQTRKPENIEIYFESLGESFSASVFSPMPGYYMNVFDVVTERKKTEDSLRQALSDARQYQFRVEVLSMLYATLSAVNSAIVHSDTEEQLFDEICRAAVSRGGFDSAWIACADTGNNCIQVLAAEGEWQDILRQKLKRTCLNDDPDLANSPALYALQSGQICVQNDVQNDPRTPCEWRGSEVPHSSSCLASYAAIPVMKAGHVCFVLGLMSTRPHFFNKETIALAEEIEHDIAFALVNFERNRERKRVQEELLRSDQRLRLSLDFAGVGTKEINLRTWRVKMDATAARMVGFDHEAQDVPLKEYLTRACPGMTEQEIEAEMLALQTAENPVYNHERQITLPDGSMRWMRSRGGYVIGGAEPDDELVALSVMLDVTDQHAQAEREQLAMKMFASSREAIAIIDAERRLVMVNDALLKLTGFGADEILRQPYDLMHTESQPEAFFRDIWLSLRTHSHWQGEIRKQCKNGQVFPALVNISVVRNPQGEITHYVEQFSDISLQKQFEEALLHKCPAHNW